MKTSFPFKCGIRLPIRRSVTGRTPQRDDSMTVRVAVADRRTEAEHVADLNVQLRAPRKPRWPGFLYFFGAVTICTALAYLFLFVI